MATEKKSPPEDHREWAQFLRSKVEGKARVVMHRDPGNRHEIPIFSVEMDGGGLAATVGLMEYDQSVDSTVAIASEVLVDAKGGREVAHVAATIGFFVMKDGWKVRPGSTFANIIPMYHPEILVKHVLFTTPFQWQEGAMSKVALTGRTVYPLLAVPITDEERSFVLSRGADALETHWESEGVDVLDWGRGSSVPSRSSR